MPSLWPPSGLVLNSERMRPCTGQRKLLPDMGSGAGSCWVLATCGFCPPMTLGALASAGALCTFAPDPGAVTVVVFTTCTSGEPCDGAGFLSLAATARGIAGALPPFG